MTSRERRRTAATLLALVVLGAIAIFAWAEARTSWLQAHILAGWAEDVGHEPGAGPNPTIRFPTAGPYDRRLGYARIPEMVERLEARGFRVTAQARTSERFRRAMDLGFFPLYREKTRAGLLVRGTRDREIHRTAYPERTYPAFDSIPRALVRTLLFIENRELLAEGTPHRNPAVEWDRLAGAALSLGLGRLTGDRAAYGGSTLATQMEKFRHSPGGLTGSPPEKLRQIGSASLRAYLDGPRTVETRRRIVLDYVNSVPLGAVAGFGEVIGLGDGLPLWTGIDFEEANRRLREMSGREGASPEAARAYRAALALLIAHRRPTFYLGSLTGRVELDRLTDSHLGVLEAEGVISPAQARAAREATVEVQPRTPSPARVPFVDRKAASAVRMHLLGLLGVPSLYELDRYDLAVRSTLDSEAQEAVTGRLRALADPAAVRAAGLDGFRLLAGGDPAKVIYSVLVYARTPTGNAVRVQADNFDGPFDLNQAARLELGSTAKLRTLVTYLEVIEELYLEHQGLSPGELASRAREGPADPLTRWAIDHLARFPDSTLRGMLEAAMERRYSASPGERFFTGGGTHVFQNFDRTFDGSVVTVREGFRHSVNLVFVRLMRDIVRYYMLRIPGSSARILEDPADPRRQEYLERFADREGREFVDRFYRKHVGKPPAELLDGLVEGRRLSPERLAWAFRSVAPDATLERFGEFLRSRSPNTSFAPRAIEDLYGRMDPAAFGLADRGYLAGIHPLELWLVAHLLERPGATRAEVLEASAAARQEVYGWLFSGRRRAAQDRGIRILLEVEAFLEIGRQWRKLGYPFDNLVPSYGTAIGSSGDRPGALAELAGILLDDGIRRPVVRVAEVRFAEGTPFETLLQRQPQRGTRVLSPEVAAVGREALLDVVRAGTARAAAGLFRGPDGAELPVGGKTGTGNNQYKVFGPGGRLIEARTVNRTATLVFTVGDRLFGVITAHVPGPDAEAFGFTSALPVRLLGLLSEDLRPLLHSPPGPFAGPASGRGPARDSPPSTTNTAPVIQSPAGDAR